MLKFEFHIIFVGQEIFLDFKKIVIPNHFKNYSSLDHGCVKTCCEPGLAAGLALTQGPQLAVP